MGTTRKSLDWGWWARERGLERVITIEELKQVSRDDDSVDGTVCTD